MRAVVSSTFLLLSATGAPGSTTPRTPLHLDSDSSGDLLLYNPSTGVWVSTVYRTNVSERFLYQSGTWDTGFTVTPARLNDDDLTDAFLYNQTTGAYAWAMNTGSGYTLTTGSWSPDWQVFAADLNKDRLHDIFLYNPVTGIWFQCTNTGATDFTYVSGTWPTDRQIVAADFDGDERTDIFAYNQTTGEWGQYLTASSGSGFATTHSGQWNPDWRLYTVTLNNDALADLFLYNPTTGVWVQCFSTTTGGVFTYASGPWSPGWSVFPVDFGGGGINDIFVYNFDTGIWVECFTNAFGGFSRYVAGQWSDRWHVSVTDFDNDGISDIFVYNRESGLYYQCLNRNNGLFDYVRGTWSQDWLIASETDRVAPPPPPPATTPYLTVTNFLAFGDSMTFGSHSRRFFFFERNHAAYPGTLGNLLGARYPAQTVTVTNAGVAGERADEGKTRLPGELDRWQPRVLLLLEGVNDINAGRTTSQIAADLRTMVLSAQSRGVAVLLAKLTPVSSTYDPSGVTPARINELNTRIVSLAAELGLGSPVDLFGAFASDPSLIAGDGLHPTDAGYTRIAETFYNEIVRRYETLR